MLTRVDELREPVALDTQLSLRPARALNYYNHLRPVKGLARRTDPPLGRRSGPGSRHLLLVVGPGLIPLRHHHTGLAGIARSRRCSACLCQASYDAKVGQVTARPRGLGVLLVFALIRGRLVSPAAAAQDFWEIAGRSGHRRRYHCHRQRAPGPWSVPSMQRQSFALGQQGPVGPRHRRSLPVRHKVLMVALPLAFVLLIAMGFAFGLPGPSSSPTAQA